MIRLERILCPTDFSKFAFRAADFAVALGGHYDAEVHFLHDYKSRMEEQVRARLEEIVPRDAREWCEVSVVVRSGKAYRELLALAGERKVDLIAMGVRGRNRWTSCCSDRRPSTSCATRSVRCL